MEYYALANLFTFKKLAFFDKDLSELPCKLILLQLKYLDYCAFSTFIYVLSILDVKYVFCSKLNLIASMI